MGKLGKILSAIVLLVVVSCAVLIAFVHYYLTEERVKSLIIPQAEAALGRDIAIGDIKIGLLSGITITDFMIKEVDKESNFISTKAFVLSYDLMPLLQKKIVISEIRLDDPTIQILRDKNGQFNFSSLKLLSDDGQKEVKKEKSSSKSALPLALTFNQISFNRAKIKILDQLDEIPAVDATTSAKFNIALGKTIKDIQYKGSFNVNATVKHGTGTVEINGKGNMDQKNLDIVLDKKINGEQLHIIADVKNYFQKPVASIDIRSKSLNIDKLLAIAAAIPQSPSKNSGLSQKATDNSKKIIADSLPAGLVANGTVKVDTAMYKGITTNDFALLFNLDKGILTVKELSAQAYNGKLDSNMIVDLNQPGLAYNGNVGMQSVKVADFSSALVKRATGMITGDLQSTMTFSGAGTAWSEIKDVLTADGSFALTDGGIKGTPVSASISTLLGLQELNNINYKNIDGTFKIVEGGKVKIKSSMQGVDLNAEAEGIIGLDGSLDLPLTLHLSPALTEKLKSRGSIAKYLADDKGGSTLNLKLTGNIRSPKPTLDMKGAKDQIKKTIQNKVFEKLGTSNNNTELKESPENLIKGLFGR